MYETAPSQIKRKEASKLMNIDEVKKRLISNRPRATEAELNKAIIDYAELIDFPAIIRNQSDFEALLSYLDCVVRGEI